MNKSVRTIISVGIGTTLFISSLNSRVNLLPNYTQINEHRRHIEARLVHNLTLHGLHGDGSDAYYRCTAGQFITSPPNYNKAGGLKGVRQALRPPLNGTGIFDFQVDISSTDLKIMLVGNSLSEQLSAGLEEAMCYTLDDKMATVDRVLLRNKSSCIVTDVPDHDNEWYRPKPLISSPAGGIIMNVMTTSFVDTDKKWNLWDPGVSALVKALKDVNRQHLPLIDIFVYQFPSGHIDLLDFHERHLEEAVKAASELFGSSMVIFPTVAAMNNVHSTYSWNLVNERIRNFVKNYQPMINSTVRSVQTLDYARLINEYMEVNAGLLGILKNDTFVLRKTDRWKTLVALQCSAMPLFDNGRGCQPGMISLDGMHLCPQTVHGRINAGLLCLLDCKYNHRGLGYQLCSDGCNDRYMSLQPVNPFHW
eukprot:scaffold92815_cov76-Cyclotella_meneghiniana.AAC.1